MKEVKKQLELIKKLSKNISMHEKKHLALQKLTTMLDSLTLEEKNEVGVELLNIMNNGLDLVEKTIEAYKSRSNAPSIIVGSQSYDLREWCTISQYAKLFNYPSTMPVSNQIRRKVIAPDRIATISDLGLKLIRLI